MKIDDKRKLCESIIKDLFIQNKWNIKKLKNLSIGITNDGALCGRKPLNWGKNIKNGLLADESIREIPVLEISTIFWDITEHPYTYKVYDEEWLKNA